MASGSGLTCASRASSCTFLACSSSRPCLYSSRWAYSSADTSLLCRTAESRQPRMSAAERAEAGKAQCSDSGSESSSIYDVRFAHLRLTLRQVLLIGRLLNADDCLTACHLVAQHTAQPYAVAQQCPVHKSGWQSRHRRELREWMRCGGPLLRSQPFDSLLQLSDSLVAVCAHRRAACWSETVVSHTLTLLPCYYSYKLRM